MRGKGGDYDPPRVFSGITPAYAGKREAISEDILLSQDHPRLCGEKLRELISTVYSLGSPPPMRGKVSLRDAVKLDERITPAYAGKRVFSA